MNLEDIEKASIEKFKQKLTRFDIRNLRQRAFIVQDKQQVSINKVISKFVHQN